MACIFLFGSNGCFVLSTLYMMTNIFRVMAISAFCGFIRLASTLCFFPRNDFFERAADHDISTRICLRYLFPCSVFRECILPADSSFLGRNPAHPTKEFALEKALISLPISDKMNRALSVLILGMVHSNEISLAKYLFANSSKWVKASSLLFFY